MDDQQPRARIQMAEEALRLLRRFTFKDKPGGDDIAQLHELHAKHEAAHGNTSRAREALRRAGRVRAQQRRPPS